ncbi:Fibulin-1, partial [Dissostichus eleginoides]
CRTGDKNLEESSILQSLGFFRIKLLPLKNNHGVGKGVYHHQVANPHTRCCPDMTRPHSHSNRFSSKSTGGDSAKVRSGTDISKNEKIIPLSIELQYQLSVTAVSGYQRLQGCWDDEWLPGAEVYVVITS